MKKLILLIAVMVFHLSCSSNTNDTTSPDGKIKLNFNIDETGAIIIRLII